MGPFPQPDGHDAPWLGLELVSRIGTVIDDVVVAGEDPVREPVIAHELPDVLLRVQLGTLGGQRHDGDVGRHGEPIRHVPPGLVEQQCGMTARRDFGRDDRQVQAHRLDVAPGQDQSGYFAVLRADSAEDVGRCRALVVRSRGPGALPGPTPGDLVLLADPGLVAKPDLYVVAFDSLLARDLVQARGEVFLKASIAPSACA